MARMFVIRYSKVVVKDSRFSSLLAPVGSIRDKTWVKRGALS